MCFLNCWSVIAYGASVWGTRNFSCIDAVQNRTQRYFLGTGKYTPTAAVAGDMGWEPPIINSINAFVISGPGSRRINKRIYNYSRLKSGRRCQNWYFRVSRHFNNFNCPEFVQPQQRLSSQSVYVKPVEREDAT